MSGPSDPADEEKEARSDSDPTITEHREPDVTPPQSDTVERHQQQDRSTEHSERSAHEQPSTQHRPVHEQGPKPSGRWTAALAGAAVTLLFGSVPFLGPICGGAIAGHLRGSDTKESVLSASVGGLLATLPTALVILFLVGFEVFGVTLGADAGVAIVWGLIWLYLLVLVAGYHVLMCAIGGLMGATITDRGAP